MLAKQLYINQTVKYNGKYLEKADLCHMKFIQLAEYLNTANLDTFK